jgi:hypothetical protein
LDKTAAYTFLKPEHWILKLVQAAVALECTEFRVGFTRELLKVELWGGEPLSLVRLPEELYASVSPTTDAASELHLGLKGLLADHEFMICDSDGLQFRWNDHRLSAANLAPEDSDERPNVALWIPRRGQGGMQDNERPNWLGKIRFRAREVVRYEELLRSRALYAPLKLVFDGLELSPSLVSRAHFHRREKSEHADSPAHLLDAQLNRCDYTEHLALNSRAQDGVRTRQPFLTLRPSSSYPTHQLQLLLAYKLENLFVEGRYLEHCEVVPTEFKVHFGRLGVVCHTAVLKAEHCLCGGAAYYDLGSECGDLSGLQVEPTVSDWNRHQQTVKELEPVLCRLESELKTHHPVIHRHQPEPEEIKKAGRLGAGLTLLGYPAMIVLGLKAVPIALGAMAASYSLGRALPRFVWSKLPDLVFVQWMGAIRNLRYDLYWNDQGEFSAQLEPG